MTQSQAQGSGETSRAEMARCTAAVQPETVTQCRDLSSQSQAGV